MFNYDFLFIFINRLIFLSINYSHWSLFNFLHFLFLFKFVVLKLN